MGRKCKPKLPKSCVVCGDKASGVNFNALTCMSCKAFFRRNALRNKEFKCPFNDNCVMDLVTRKFCAKCRLRKCVQEGMKKEWILTEEEKLMYKNKVLINRLRREEADEFICPLENAPSVCGGNSGGNGFAPLPNQPPQSSHHYQQQQPSSSSSNSPPSTSSYIAPPLPLVSATASTFHHHPQQQRQSQLYNHPHHLHHHHHQSNASCSTFTTGGEPPNHPQVDLYESSPPSSHHTGPQCSSSPSGLWSNQDSPNSNISATKSEITFNSPKIEEAVPLVDPAEDLSSLFADDGAFHSFEQLDDNDVMDILTLSESLMDPTFPANQCVPYGQSSSNSTSGSRSGQNNSSSCSALMLRDPTAIDRFDYQNFTLRNYDSSESQGPNPFRQTPMYREPGFPAEDLIFEEKVWIGELANAGSVMHNPYMQIKDYQRDYAPVCSAKLTQFFFYRMIRMCKKLKAFEALMPIDQGRMLKHRLLELLAVRSVLMYHKDRDAWCFVDDKNKVGVMARMDLLKPFCRYDYRRHQNLPNLFRDEWKRDNIIFDLLTVIILFTPRSGMIEYEKVSEEHHRYKRLLHRYLNMKYGNAVEAQEAYDQLMGNIEELRLINVDVFNFYKSYSNALQGSPLFTDLLDLRKSVVSAEAFNGFSLQ